MKRYLVLIVLFFTCVVVLFGCGDSITRESELSENINVQTKNTNNNNSIPEYVQNIYNGYSGKIKKHGDLVAKTSEQILKANNESFSYTFSLLPIKDESSLSDAIINFDAKGSQTLLVSVREPTPSYLEELLVLLLVVIDPEMSIDETKVIVDNLNTSFYSSSSGESEKVIIGDYTVYITKGYLSVDIIYAESTKTAFDVYDFDKSVYQCLTYDLYVNPANYENERFYIEGMCTKNEDGMTLEIIDSEENHFTLKFDKFWFYEGAMCKLYGRLKTDVYGEPYFYVEYPYGL